MIHKISIMIIIIAMTLCGCTTKNIAREQHTLSDEEEQHTLNDEETLKQYNAQRVEYSERSDEFLDYDINTLENVDITSTINKRLSNLGNNQALIVEYAMDGLVGEQYYGERVVTAYTYTKHNPITSNLILKRYDNFADFSTALKNIKDGITGISDNIKFEISNRIDNLNIKEVTQCYLGSPLFFSQYTDCIENDTLLYPIILLYKKENSLSEITILGFTDGKIIVDINKQSLEELKSTENTNKLNRHIVGYFEEENEIVLEQLDIISYKYDMTIDLYNPCIDIDLSNSI